MPKEKFFDPRKPFQSQRPETHEEWQARMGGEVLAVVRSGLYLDFRFLDMALSALTPAPDERCRALASQYSLTPRELEVFQMLARGRDRAYIQEQLVVSRNTVKAHVKHIYAKLDIHSHQDLIDLVEKG